MYERSAVEESVACVRRIIATIAQTIRLMRIRREIIPIAGAGRKRS